MIGVDIAGIDSVVGRLQSTGARIESGIADAVENETALLAETVKERMAALFKNPDKMQASVGSQVTSSAGSMVGTVFVSGLPYLGIQEYGGITRPHDIFPVNAKVLAFHGGGFLNVGGDGMVFARHVHHPGSHIPARSYLRSALDQRRNAILAAMRDAVSTAVA